MDLVLEDKNVPTEIITRLTIAKEVKQAILMYYGDTEKHIVLQRITDCLFVNTKRYNLMMFALYIISVILFCMQEFFFTMTKPDKQERDKKGIITCNILYLLILLIFLRFDLISIKNDVKGHFESFYNVMSFGHFFM